MLRLIVFMAAVALMALPVSAATPIWSAVLSSDQEIPPNASTAAGSGWVQYDTVANDLTVNMEWAGLTGVGVQAHIHCCVSTPPGNVGIALDLWLPSDPSRPATGSFNDTYDLDAVNPFRAAFTTANGGTVEAALAALIASMDSGEGRAYFNIHTEQFPGGEIRGNLAPIPEPGTMTGVLIAVGATLALRRWRHR